MSLDALRFRSLHTPTARNHAARKFKQLQSDLVSTAQILAADEVGAVIAHQLNEPLTALMIYLNEIKRGRLLAETDRASDPIHGMVENALRETRRVYEILERLGSATTRSGIAEPQDRIESPVPRGEGAADLAVSVVVPMPNRSCLTPREEEVLTLITGGTSNKEGGYRLGISTRTFEVHRAHIMKKYGAKNAADLVRIAIGKSMP